MVTVGSVNCAEEEALCKLLARRSGVVFYPAKEVTHEREIVCNRFCCRSRHTERFNKLTKISPFGPLGLAISSLVKFIFDYTLPFTELLYTHLIG